MKTGTKKKNYDLCSKRDYLPTKFDKIRDILFSFLMDTIFQSNDLFGSYEFLNKYLFLRGPLH